MNRLAEGIAVVAAFFAVFCHAYVQKLPLIFSRHVSSPPIISSERNAASFSVKPSFVSFILADFPSSLSSRLSRHCCRCRCRRSRLTIAKTTDLFSSSSSRWDALVDEEEEEDNESDGGSYRKPLPGPRDMTYTPQNILRQNDRFVSIRHAGGPELTNDMYARADASTDLFWFVGKVARVTDVSTELAVARQWNLIEEHASRLRPLELFPHRGSMELWAAPGDSEMDVAYNRPGVKFVRMRRIDEVDGARNVRAVEVGFQGEIYDAGEEGFRTWRTEDGFAKKEEVGAAEMEKGPKRAPTDEEFKDIQELLKGKDLNEFFDDGKS